MKTCTVVNVMVTGQSSGPMAATDHKIRSFRDLKPGWHYGKGVAADHSIIRIARNYHSMLLTLGYFETDAFPGVDGEIMVTAYRGKNCVEITVDLDRTFVVTHSFDGQDLFHESELSGIRACEALGTITANIEQQECNILSWLTSNTIMTGVLESLRILPLNHQTMVAALQSLGKIVALPQAVQYVPMLANTTPALGETRPYFGNSMILKSLIPAT